jgi:ATP-dependent helicase/nuclease subunit A
MKETSAKEFLDADLLAAPEDPTISQRRAAAPSRHVWVRASAGSGKTKVLVDRILRLLLPDPVTKAPGITPDKILCLTFTKAGAAEMSLRLQRQLLKWSAAEDDDLKIALKDLTNLEADELMLQEARRLFARVLDAPSRLRILTIHSFCQSVLGRFPIETGLSPDFKVIEDSEQSEFLQRSLHEILAKAVAAPGSDLGQAFSRLAISKNIDQLRIDLKKLILEPIKLQNFLQDSATLGDVQERLAQAFGIENIEGLTFAGFCDEATLPRNSIRILADILGTSSGTDMEKSQTILTWLSAGAGERLSTLDSYIKTIRAKPRGKAAYSNADFLERQAQEIARIDRCRLAGNIRSTADLLYLARLLLASYDRHKKHLGVMDYNDLIFHTRRLLSGEFWKGDLNDAARSLSTAWVLYKLDEGIDHILVDESQDTNPDQWDIVARLSAEYFSGSARPVIRARTLFVVGDEKQSIFSFQRADPAEFHRMREYFSEKVAPTQAGFEESLIYSFRTTSPVLKLTDATFADAALRHHIGLKDGSDLRHISFRTDKKKELSGSVEIWPPVIAEKKPPLSAGWQFPFSDDPTQKPAAQILAQRLARHLKTMIDKGEAAPADIMILMRTRSPLMLHIIRELKNLSLPVSGLDRMVLSQSLIVQDILAVCDFALLNDDSFSLGVLLKSPFVGLTDDELMHLAVGRDKDTTLWSVLRSQPQYAAISEWLKKLSRFTGEVQPYEFIEELLTQPCPADPQGSGYRAAMKRLGADTIEPLDEILGQALKLELQDIRTLQDFTDFQKNTTKDIKREMEEAAAEIRIMTVHASKGLEAPIVILPDTMSVPTAKGTDTFLWPDKSGLGGPLWAESKEERSDLYEAAFARAYDLQMEEQSRLLYVAMTRAKDRLIICGAHSSENINAKSWYAAIDAGFARLGDVKTLDSGVRIYSLGNPPLAARVKPVADLMPFPEWLRNPAPQEGDAPVAFAPSKQDADEQPAASPLDPTNTQRFRRGLATHKLLQILPDLLPERREAAARNYVSRPALGLSQDLQDNILTETMRVLNDPVFAPVFAPGSLAEVPVTGEISPGRIINGQIDRLVITETEVLIVDFKTNRPSPRAQGDIPIAYKAQLKAYADAVSLIYPGRAVKCALLWTDQPLLMPVAF